MRAFEVAVNLGEVWRRGWNSVPKRTSSGCGFFALLSEHQRRAANFDGFVSIQADQQVQSWSRT